MGAQDRQYMKRKAQQSSCGVSRTSAGCGCGGKDLGPLEEHEGPSESDIEQFSGVTRVCSECNTEVYDEAEICHNCGHAFTRAEDGRGLPSWAVATTLGIIALAALGFIYYTV